MEQIERAARAADAAAGAVRRMTPPAIAVRTALDRTADSAERAARAQESLARATALAIKAARNSIAGFDELHLAKQEEADGEKKKSSSSRKNGSGAGKGSGGGQEEFPWLPRAAGWDAVKMGLEALLAPAVDSWQRAFAQVRAAAQESFAGVRAAAQSLWQNALGPLLEQIAFGVVPGIVNAISTALAPLAGGAGAGVLTALGAAFAALCSVAENLYTTVLGPVIAGVGRALSEVWQGHVAPLFTQLGALLAQAGEAVAAFWTGAVAPLLNHLVDTFGPALADVMLAAGDVLAAFLAAASDALSGVTEALSGVLAFLTGVFAGDWAAAWQGVRQVFAGVWEAVASLARSAVNGIIGCVNGLLAAVAAGVNAVAGALNAIRVDVPDWVPVFGGRSFGISLPTVTAPQIPYLAQGAVIPPHAAFLAVLGDQAHGRNLEAPEGLLRQIVREEAGGSWELSASQPVELRLDGDVVYRAMMDIRARRGVRMGGVFADAR